MRHQHTRLAVILLIAIAFAAVEWGGRDVRFGVTILFVAFVAFLAGRKQWMPKRERTARYEDLVDAETRALSAEEELIVQRAQAENHVRALLRAPRVSESDRVRDRDAALEWLHEAEGETACVTPSG